MRILYFSNITFATSKSKGYNGGGWIKSLIFEVKKSYNSHVAVGFLGDKDACWDEAGIKCYQIGNITGSSRLSKIIRDAVLLCGDYKAQEIDSWTYYEDKFLKIIDDFHPDVIHVFGSEQHFGLVANRTKIPVILHIQGILNPCRNALFPPSFSLQSMMRCYNFKSQLLARYQKKIWELHCMREREILERVRYYIGRTEWDRRITLCFNQHARYFYGSEVLRDEFYGTNERCIPEQLEIVSTISNSLYKGFDMILKTAYVLKNYIGVDFIWKIFGNINPNFVESIIAIKHDDVNVKLMGVASSKMLKQELLSATCYMHPSYIDNSPNSLCEAQILGVPVVACNVGGLSSMIEDGKTGFLVPANDPYQAAFLILNLHTDRILNDYIGKNACEISLKRHNKVDILRELFSVYNQLLTDNK